MAAFWLKMTETNTLYTCGRMHKPTRKRKLSSHRANALLERLSNIVLLKSFGVPCAQIVAQLQCELFSMSSICKSEPSQHHVPRLWMPTKPNITMAILEAMVDEHDQEGQPEAPCVGAGLTKVVARHIVSRMMINKGDEWLEKCGELSKAQLESQVKVNHTLSRAAFDLFVYVHARAIELRRDDGVDAVLQLHSADETLCGRELRGTGVVYCPTGRRIFAKACALVRDALQPS